MKSHRSTTTTTRLRRSARVILLTSLASLLAGPVATRADQAFESWRTVYNLDVQAGQAGNATVADSRGNIIVAGFTAVSGGTKNFYTAKYAALDGSLVWEKIYNTGLGDNVANAVAVDSQDNVIVTGKAASAGNNADFYTAKYAGEDGALIWQKSYAGQQGGADEATKVVVDSNDAVIVTGTSFGNGTQEDWFTIKYSSDGISQWGGNNGGLRFNGGGNQKDVPNDLAVTSTGNAVVVGRVVNNSGKAEFYTVEYNSTTGAILWSAVAPGLGGDGEATAVAIDKSNRVAVTGIRSSADNQRAGYAAEYSTTGAVLWSDSLDFGAQNFSGGPSDLALDDAGDVYLTGTFQGSDNFSTTYIATTKLLGADSILPGGEVWTQYSAAPDHTDVARRVAVDSGGNVIVFGSSNEAQDHHANFLLERRSAIDGTLRSTFGYDGTFGDDLAKDLALDRFGNVAVVGLSSLPYQNTNINYNRITTIRYERLRVSTGDLAPGAGVTDSGVPAGAQVSAISAPALADNGALAVKVTLVKGTWHRTALVVQSAGGKTDLLALEGAAGGGLRRWQLRRLSGSRDLAGRPGGILRETHRRTGHASHRRLVHERCGRASAQAADWHDHPRAGCRPAAEIRQRHLLAQSGARRPPAGLRHRRHEG